MRARWISWLVVGLFSWVAAGCDREKLSDEPSEIITDDEQVEVIAQGQVDDVELVEPFDIGPEGPAIYFLSGLKGYTEPCGCTADVLLGGIDRITAFVNDAMALHSDAIFIDAGDWLFEHAELPEHMQPQERAKADVLAEAHRQMGTLFSVPGNRDMALGAPLYLEMMEAAQMRPLGANVEILGQALDPSMRVELGETAVLFVGAVDPELFEGVDEVIVWDEVEAVAASLSLRQDGEVVVLVYQGDHLRARAVAEAVGGIDFVVVGHDPRRRDEPESVEGLHLVEAYDQGRYVGRLKLYGSSFEGPFVDARGGGMERRASLRRQIEHVENDLRLLEVRTGGESNAMTERLEARLADLQTELDEQIRQAIEIPEEGRAFLFDAIAMVPGYRLHEEMQERREEYNRSLAELSRGVEREVIPVADGEAFYIGTDQCTACHGAAHSFWEGTAHSSAVATLEERHKEYDQNCIGCHVVGWEEPGGSVLGQLVYEAEIGGHGFEKDLRDVGCESCHGPGSEHFVAPLDAQGVAQNIIAAPTEAQCVQCHVPEHSPRFDFDVYVRRVTGEGHEYSGSD